MNPIPIFISFVLLTGCSAAQVAPELENYTEELTFFSKGSGDSKEKREIQKNVIKPFAASLPFQCERSLSEVLVSEVPLVDMNFIDMDLKEALLELSILTEIPIIVDDSVEGLVSATIVSKPFDVALDMLTAFGNYGYKKYPDYVLVGSQNPSSPSMSILAESCTFKPRFLLAEQLQSLLGSPLMDYTRVDIMSNVLSISAPKRLQNSIHEKLILLDRRRSQILLEMSIIEVNREVLNLIGIDWTTLIEKGLEIAAQKVLNNDNNGYYFNNGSGYSAISMQTFRNTIGLLKSNGAADIKAMPSIITLDGNLAHFQSTQQVWLGDSRSRRKDDAIVFGVNMEVIPHIASDSTIRLEIRKASVSDITEGPGGNPSVIEHSVSNNVEVKNGELLILGGLLQKKQKNYDASFPGLSKLPLLGKRLFNQKKEQYSETEVLIVIRPTIASL